MAKVSVSPVVTGASMMGNFSSGGYVDNLGEKYTPKLSEVEKKKSMLKDFCLSKKLRNEFMNKCLTGSMKMENGVMVPEVREFRNIREFENLYAEYVKIALK